MGLVVVFLTLGIGDAPEPSYTARSDVCGFGSESGAPGFVPLFDHAEENFIDRRREPEEVLPAEHGGCVRGG